MRTTRLGDSHLEVPVIGLGCMVLPGAAQGTRYPADQMAAVHR